MTKPVCLFDSGIGGLTVLKKLLNRFPNEDYVYLADLARVPFGDKTKTEMRGIAVEIIEWLSRFNPKLIVMACNTSSAILASELQVLSSRLDVPIYGMINSCAKEIAMSSYLKVSVWATKLVTQTGAYSKAIGGVNPTLEVEEIACPKLVPTVEDLTLSLTDKVEIIYEYLSKTSKDTQAIVLGCTHYPLLQEEIRNLAKIDIVDPTDDLLTDLEKHLTPCDEVVTRQISLYATAKPEKIQRFSEVYLGRRSEVTLTNLAKAAV